MDLSRAAGRNVTYDDLREFINQVADLQALRHVAGADPKFEIGGFTEVAAGLPDCPALLFDHIHGYPAGFRVFTNATTGARPWRWASIRRCGHSTR
jgi:4-hydroxy-3-polyprenylbenzoate decarboxylase